MGALSTPENSPSQEPPGPGQQGLPKSATLPTGKPQDDILGSPFADEMSRSSVTLPSDASQAPPSTPSNSLSSLSSSIKSLTKSSGMGSRLSSLKKGSSYISSYLSPNPATSKKTQEALSQGIASMRSAYTNAATLVGKRVEEIRESVQQPGSPPTLSPAGSYQYLHSADGARVSSGLRAPGGDEAGDALSTCSGGESRRPSAIDQAAYLWGGGGGGGGGTDQSIETWSSLTGALWDQFWGTGEYAPRQGARPSFLKASEVTEQFESLYAKLPKRLPGPEAMQIQMTSCSRCLYCHGILFDEEIMAGWTAEDSNLNTRCLFCNKMVVPFLTIRAVDFRSRPCPNNADPDKKGCEEVAESGKSDEDEVDNGGGGEEQTEETGEEQTEESSTDDASMKKEGDKTSEKKVAAAECHPTLEHQASVSEPITVPYLSPLVLRKELESMLEREGDQCLVEAACVDTHPIIFWNLLWYFERVAVKSHLPGHCLKAASLNRDDGTSRHESWSGADHRNVYIKCRWDNERLHDSKDPPLYTLWKHQNVSQAVVGSSSASGHKTRPFFLDGRLLQSS